MKIQFLCEHIISKKIENGCKLLFEMFFKERELKYMSLDTKMKQNSNNI